MEPKPKKRKYTIKSKFWLQKKNWKHVVTSRSKVAHSNCKPTSLISSSAQLLDRSTGEPVNVNCAYLNNNVFQGNSNVEQDGHLDTSSEWGWFNSN